MDTQDMGGLDRSGLIAARRRLIDMHHRARVGHLGGNLSALDAMWVLFQRHLAPADRFILSKGHSAGALYVALWSVGRLSDAELDTFHADGTRLPGHPPCQGLADVPFATGSLGHGLSLAAGTALAHRLQGAAGHVHCLTSDGEWQEGSTWEALVFACHHRLDGLTILIDHNGLQGFGRTAEVASMDPLWERLAGFDLAPRVIDGHDIDAIDHALRTPADAGRPRVIVLRTVKGHGVPAIAGRMDSHYLPLTDAQHAQAIAELERS